MEAKLEPLEHYSVLTLESPDQLRESSPEDFITIIRESGQPTGNPVIVAFSRHGTMDEKLFTMIRQLHTSLTDAGYFWVLVPPFSGHLDQLESHDIPYAPTMEEAEDMAYMIRLEQELREEGDEPENE